MCIIYIKNSKFLYNNYVLVKSVQKIKGKRSKRKYSSHSNSEIILFSDFIFCNFFFFKINKK